MTKYSFPTTMFSRLPLYSRPKEPAIGQPVLTQSSNERLSGRPRPSYRSGSPAALPPIPTGPSFVMDDDSTFPTGPIRAETLPPARTSTPPFRISRKPTPAENPIWDGRQRSLMASTVTTITSSKTPPPPPAPASAPQKSAFNGYGLGGILKARRSKQREPEEPVEETVRVPETNLPSIDSWLESREGVHKRSNTVNTVATQRRDPRKLHLRQSTFEPLRPPGEFVSTDPEPPLPALPQIPSQYAERTSSVPPPVETERIWEDTAEGRVGRLEWEQEGLERRKQGLRRDIWECEMRLKEGMEGEERRRVGREKERREEEVAGVEKELHDLGMRLHRAYRRLDERDGKEGPTHLWVSRATQ